VKAKGKAVKRNEKSRSEENRDFSNFFLETVFTKGEYPYFCNPERERYSSLAQLVRASDC
jgi:hypothetical protein